VLYAADAVQYLCRRRITTSCQQAVAKFNFDGLLSGLGMTQRNHALPSACFRERATPPEIVISSLNTGESKWNPEKSLEKLASYARWASPLRLYTFKA